ncbi:MAG: HDIG domain-containing metalloprotein [Candidatus Margulisiibacteriota bacterium]
MTHESLFTRLPYRARQLFFTLFSRYQNEQISFARKYLNITELALFDRLPKFEKKHAVRAAKAALRLAHGKSNIDERRLAKICLLHDIGKAATRLWVLDKVMLVILRRYFKRLYDYLSKKGEHEKALSIFRKFYVYKHHGEIGAAMLKRAGVPADIAEIVSRHTQDPHPGEPVDLQILRQADAA